MKMHTKEDMRPFFFGPEVEEVDALAKQVEWEGVVIFGLGP